LPKHFILSISVSETWAERDGICMDTFLNEDCVPLLARKQGDQMIVWKIAQNIAQHIFGQINSSLFLYPNFVGLVLYATFQKW
jgi:hypothetical protein